MTVIPSQAGTHPVTVIYAKAAMKNHFK